MAFETENNLMMKQDPDDNFNRHFYAAVAGSKTLKNDSLYVKKRRFSYQLLEKQ